MLSGRVLLAALVAVFLIAACDHSIVYVDRPGPLRFDTTVVIVPRPETSFVQLPGRVDTVVTVRRDTLRIITHDTVVVHDTLRHTDTLVKRDTLVRRDTVVRVDTVVKRDTIHDTVTVHRSPVELPRLHVNTAMPAMPLNGDTLYACTPQGCQCRGPCDGSRPGGRVIQVGSSPAAIRSGRSALILPGWSLRH